MEEKEEKIRKLERTVQDLEKNRQKLESEKKYDLSEEQKGVKEAILQKKNVRERRLSVCVWQKPSTKRRRERRCFLNLQ